MIILKVNLSLEDKLFEKFFDPPAVLGLIHKNG